MINSLKMSSKRQSIKPYNIDDVNKKIIAKAAVVRPVSDLIGPLNNYRDEDVEIYKRKKQQFLESAKQYNGYLQRGGLQTKVMLDRDHDEMIFRGFLDNTRTDVGNNNNEQRF